MGMYESFVSFFQSGGIFMIPIVIVLAVGLAIAIERYVYLSATRAKNQIAWKKIQTVLTSGNMNEAMNFAEKSKCAISKIMGYGVASAQSSRRMMMWRLQWKRV